MKDMKSVEKLLLLKNIFEIISEVILGTYTVWHLDLIVGFT